MKSVDNSVEVFVPGNPAPQGSKRHVGNGVMIESSKRLKPWRTDVREALIAKWGARPPMMGAIQLYLLFIMPRPKSLPRSKPTPAAIKRPDWDKLSRAICDAITSSGVYGDDSQVVTAVVRKRICEIGEAPGCLIIVRSLE